jgi:hypothetical protein
METPPTKAQRDWRGERRSHLPGQDLQSPQAAFTAAINCFENPGVHLKMRFTEIGVERKDDPGGGRILEPA